MPRPDNAIATLAKAMATLADYETPLRLIPETRQFLATLARTSPPPLADAFGTLASSSDPDALAAADRLVSRDPLMHALIRNTLAPVLMSAGFRSNVIPGSAEATVNARLIPGADPNDVVEEIRRAIDDPRVEVRLATPAAGPSPLRPSPVDTDLFRALDRHAREVFPGVEVTPYVFQAGTDAGAWRSRGVPVYGIYPYPISAEDLTRMHGNDERVRIESLRQGTEWVYQTLVTVAGRE
jgi:acetylornithine deacetylase/succinyl-diaminopimelate desuccinylase-like protein